MLLTARESLDKIDWTPLIPSRLLVVAADYNQAITDMLLDGTIRRLDQRFAPQVDVVRLAGALEIPALIYQSHTSRPYDGYLALGCVLRGETSHYEIVTRESARGLTLLGQQGALIANGILATETLEQARLRADPAQGDRGGDAADALLRLMLAANSMHRVND